MYIYVCVCVYIYVYIYICIPVYNTCALLWNGVEYVGANLDAPDDAISDSGSSSEMLAGQSQISE